MEMGLDLRRELDVEWTCSFVYQSFNSIAANADQSFKRDSQIYERWTNATIPIEMVNLRAIYSVESPV